MPKYFTPGANLFACVFWILLCAGTALPGMAQKMSAEDLNGKSIDPFAEHGKQAVVLLFVRTDCPISNRYAPTIQKLSEKFQGQVKFWLVYPDKAESPESIRKHEHAFHYELPALRDLRHTLVKQSGAQITPEAAVFDANHRLVYHGRIDNLYADFGRARARATTHELDDAIRAAIDGKMLPADNPPAVGCYISDLE